MFSLSVMRTYLFLICVTFPYLSAAFIGIQPRHRCPIVATVIKNNFHNTVDNICGTLADSHVANFLLPEPILCSVVKYLSQELCEKQFEPSRIQNAVKRTESRICDYYKEMRLDTNKEIPPNYNKLFATNLTCEKTCTDVVNEPHPLCKVIVFANYLLGSNKESKQEPENLLASGGVDNTKSVVSQLPSNEEVLPGSHSQSDYAPVEPQVKIDIGGLQENRLDQKVKEQIPKEAGKSDTNSETLTAAAAVENKNKISGIPSGDKGMISPGDKILKSQNQNNPSSAEATEPKISSDTSKIKNISKNEMVPTQSVENNAQTEMRKTDAAIQNHEGGKIVDSGNNSSKTVITGNIVQQESKDRELSEQKTMEQPRDSQTFTEQEAKDQSSKPVAEHNPQEAIKKPLIDQKTSGKLNMTQPTLKEVIQSQSSETVQGGKADHADGKKDTLSSHKPEAPMDLNVNNVLTTSMDDLTVSKEHNTDNTGSDLAELDTRYPVDIGELSDNTDFFGGGGTGVDDASSVSGVLDSGLGTGVDGARPASDALDIVKTDMDPGTAVLHDNYKYDTEDSHFFAYFMTTMIFCIVGYLLFHNKQKILALALEGRARRGRRRPNTSGYRKLDSNLEEAIGSSKNSSVTQIIY